MSKIEIQNLTVDYTEKNKRYTALDNLSFSVEAGEFVSVIGSSGCGKSTLLSILEGINHPTKGEILIDGKPVQGTGTDRGVVFQHYSLFPWMTARKNVAFGIRQVKKNISKALIPFSFTLTRDSFPSVISAPAVTKSDSMSCHSMSAFTGSVKIASQVFLFLLPIRK